MGAKNKTKHYEVVFRSNEKNMILLWDLWQSPWPYFQLFIPVLIGSLVVGSGATLSTGAVTGLEFA